ncbi:RHS repeat protein [Duganella ginsengisoli]|uniref:RHS repeat protein n=2 Tax=Pseudoduganella ginsengisoli TaxID=1462440 RepID=A0A6L6PXC5_9BURK|nr:RHS repeat protein [Pseudoduganella ginsengisoli]
MEKSDNLGNKETYTWSQREITADRRRFQGPELVWDAKTWAADMASRTIYRDGATYTTTFSNYDQYGNAGTIVESGPNGGSRTTTRTYNIDTAKWLIGQVKDEIHAGKSTTRVFNSNGKVASVTNDGVTTSYTYDAGGNLATVTHPRGLVHSYSNYMRGIAQTENQPENITISRVVDAAGNVTSETNGEGQTTTTTFDKLNRPTYITYPIGSTKAFSYGPNWKTVTRGYLVERTDFDGFGLPLQVSLGGIVTTYAHDAFGNKTFQSNPGSAVGTRYTYDQFGRVKTVTNADGSVESTTYGAGSVSVTDERNQTTTHTYRAYGDPNDNHVMAITTPEPAANVSIVRNSADLITSVTQGGVTRTYTYNANQYLTGVTNPETGATVMGRDIAGNMTSRQVGTSGTTTFAYDGQNRLQSITYPDSTPSVTKTYSKTGKLKSVTTSAAARSYVYDANDNLVSETQTVDGVAMTVGYGYNTVDQLSSITYPRANHVVDYAPDVYGRPTKVSGYISSIAYWPSGQVKQLTYANGMVTSYQQNDRLWPSSFSTQKGGAYFINSSYTYDGNGNLTAVSDSADGAYNRTLGYDGIDRLVSAAGSWGAGAIAYDGAGNIKSQVLGGSSLYYSYDANNRLSSISGKRAGSFAYDALGNVIAAPGNTFVYDSAFNLKCANCASSTNKVDYVYDGLNQRVSVTKAGVKSYEMYGSHGNQLVEYTPAQSNKLTEYIYLGGKRIAQRTSTQ